MNPTDFPESNFTFTAPEGMQDCLDLKVCKAVDQNGYPIIVSCWEPSIEELEEIVKTGKVYLAVYSTSLPPVSLMGISPFEQ